MISDTMIEGKNNGYPYESYTSNWSEYEIVVSDGYTECTFTTSQKNKTPVLKDRHRVGETPLEWKLGKEATCTEDGYYYQECDFCNQTFTDSIKATGHQNTKFVVKTAATCTTDGIENEVCLDYGETLSSRKIPAGHNYDGGTKCLLCGYSRLISDFSWNVTSSETTGNDWPVITIPVNKTYKIEFNGTGLTKPFADLYNIVFYELLNNVYVVVDEPTHISITPDGTIKGLSAGTTQFKATGYLVGDRRRIVIKVVDYLTETKYNNETLYANTIEQGIKYQFKLSNVNDIDVFKFKVPSNSKINIRMTYNGDGFSGPNAFTYCKILDGNETVLNSGSTSFPSEGGEYTRSAYCYNSTYAYFVVSSHPSFQVYYPRGYLYIELL